MQITEAIETVERRFSCRKFRPPAFVSGTNGIVKPDGFKVVVRDHVVPGDAIAAVVDVLVNVPSPVRARLVWRNPYKISVDRMTAVDGGTFYRARATVRIIDADWSNINLGWT